MRPGHRTGSSRRGGAGRWSHGTGVDRGGASTGASKLPSRSLDGNGVVSAAEMTGIRKPFPGSLQQRDDLAAADAAAHAAAGDAEAAATAVELVNHVHHLAGAGTTNRVPQ